MRPASEIEWCGARKGRDNTSVSLGPNSPATEWILVAASASSGLRSGRMPGSRRANMVLPAPGGPIMSRLWPPAAATSRARLACSWPRTSLKSYPVERARLSCVAKLDSNGGRSTRPSMTSTASRRVDTA